MGLDMYLYASKPTRGLRWESLDDAANPFDWDVDFPRLGNDEQIHYWRGHYNLNGWMETLYREKGGQHEFNCVNVKLTREDLDALERSVRGGLLPYPTRFFSGESEYKQIDSDLQAIQLAREKIAAGFLVYYTCWW